MNLSIGIVGLPNVGKSSLFNVLTSQSVLAANYPFATIDPNIGVVTVPDERLFKIAEITKPQKIVPAYVEFVDIAGLVRGASQGHGLGNKFLSHIKSVAAIVHVVRNFSDPNIIHVENTVDPVRDIDLIETELIVKDIETIENRINAIKSHARFNKDLQELVDYLQSLLNFISNGALAIDFNPKVNDFIYNERKNLFLLTDKPVIYLINSSYSDAGKINNPNLLNKLAHKKYVVMDISLENEIINMSDEEKKDFLKDFGVENTAKDMLIRSTYELLGLISFFTQGPMEVRAWTIKKGTYAPEASGSIHSDFQKNFICVEVIKYQDFVEYGGWDQAKSKGKLFLGGKDYVIQDGDILIVKHN